MCEQYLGETGLEKGLDLGSTNQSLYIFVACFISVSEPHINSINCVSVEERVKARTNSGVGVGGTSEPSSAVTQRGDEHTLSGISCSNSPPIQPPELLHCSNTFWLIKGKNTLKPQCCCASLLSVTHKAGLHLACNIRHQHNLTKELESCWYVPAGVKPEMLGWHIKRGEQVKDIIRDT